MQEPDIGQSAIEVATPVSKDDVHLREIIDHVSHLLPQQGPITVFVHHNTLHAFEHLEFEEAVVVAGKQFDCEPFLKEERYREELRDGRIDEAGVDAVLAEELGSDADEIVVATVTRQMIWRELALRGFPDASSTMLQWLLSETPALARFRDDLPAHAREAVRASIGSPPEPGAESDELHALWAACLAGVDAVPLAERPVVVPRRQRDLLNDTWNVDIDRWIHPVLIRFVGAYLDQGTARVAMPNREAGLRTCFHNLYSTGAAALAGRWAASLPRLVAADRELPTALDSLQASLDALGVPPEEWQDKLVDTALALRGWAGMVHQVALRPDRVPAIAVPATLEDFLAVRLLMERAAIAHAARAYAGFSGTLAELRDYLHERWEPPRAPNTADRAWPIFHLAQLCGLSSSAVADIGGMGILAIERELRRFDNLERRRVLHLAYERHFRHRLYDALLDTTPTVRASPPEFQAMFCIDDREESIRRHLEEADGGVETFGVAGFFGVAMYYQGVNDAFARPLCPVSIHPQHYVHEAADEAPAIRTTWREMRRRGVGLASEASLVGSRSLGGGALLSVLGVFALVPLVLRVVFPRLARRLSSSNLLRVRHTHLAVERTDEVPPIGQFSGYTVEEMAAIVGGLLRSIGVAERLSPLVFVIGHGSMSLNNPMESAHECGACAGAPGGPNGRAFAQMANDPRVRELLATDGIEIPAQTWFVGGQRNTSSNAITLFDEEQVPEALAPLLDRAKAAIRQARETEAHERARRFEAMPTWAGPSFALMHVESRAVDLAQPRPEFGHATNAICIVGRRSRTESLFLDRRAFLVSYDPTTDEDNEILAGVLAAVVPVCAGINLEYYFGYVDPTGYGCGTKLPHNVTSLLGVMNGAQSDLRSGLPWEMVEIHEPVRMAMVIEAQPEAVERVLEGNAALKQLVDNRWFFLACLRPDGGLAERGPDGFVEYASRHPVPSVHGRSAAVYAGKRGHLPFTKMGLRSAEEALP